MNKIIIIAGVVLVVFSVVYGFLNMTAPQMPINSEPVDLKKSEPVNKDSSFEDREIVYTDAGYAPATLTIKKGETVTFKNQSTRSMWTASAMHPTHAGYPTTGGCIGSTFDACRGVMPGDSWSFKFDSVGTWKYHDHLTTGYYGTVIVQ